MDDTFSYKTNEIQEIVYDGGDEDNPSLEQKIIYDGGGEDVEENNKSYNTTPSRLCCHLGGS